jgi:hypothetical protein
LTGPALAIDAPSAMHRLRARNTPDVLCRFIGLPPGKLGRILLQEPVESEALRGCVFGPEFGKLMAA